ncbi:hypothetical protein ID866_7146 [Astraeus odoratus]|nr:hypothetical protein ID866_7146 [Astraeus odoratus]
MPSMATYLAYKRAVKSQNFRLKIMRNPASLRLSSFLRNHSRDDPALDCLLEELLKSRRVLAAKKVFARVAPTVYAKRRTVLANVLLHGIACQPAPRNSRRVRKLLSLVEDLSEKHHFQPDRVTVNIIIKAILSWRSVFDNIRLRALLDHLVRGGYPAGEFSRQHPPFGTVPTLMGRSLTFEKFGISENVDFNRHVRPLYRMFAKGFYARGDVEGARRVIGILKLEEQKNELAKEC